MASSCKLSMAEFKALRQSRAKVDVARQKEREGDTTGARAAYEEAIAAAPSSITALVGHAMLMWGDAADQSALNAVEETLRKALTVAQTTTSQQELDMAKIAETKLCLFLCQEGREDEARAMLQGAGFEYRLAADILRYRTSGGGGGRGGGAERREFVQAVDGALPLGMLEHLQGCFGRDALYWREHDYHSEQTGYFSYLHKLSETPTSNLEQIIEHVRGLCVQRFPKVAEAQYCEMWAHCRPHASGHQMHFDSDDEGVGGVRNPIVSTVIYLTESIGGPTLVTNQRLTDSSLATKGWIVLPKLNRLVIFDGSTLHGVVPGRGCRVTLMLAFWREIKFRPSESEEPGASRPFPARGKTKFTWPDAFHDLKQEWGGEGSHQREDVQEIEELGGVWERADGSPLGDAAADGTMPDYSQCFQGF